ncbi:MAG: prepilin-type N-terminal cleavage/methylation domain-containing protein [Armatimonadetes bacterium]|nr:prepilin-type N-terminal cleavage/methylation domain-containing protein [Armatimonadota bacterium]
MRRNKAFTLIELLVVIAIIAILAAILFPVFAQAKAAAKKTAAISNSKQNALATLMYIDNNDDTFPQSAYFEVNGTTKNLVSAYDAIYPYTKNVDIFKDPADPEAIKWDQILANTSIVPGGPWLSPQKIARAGVGLNFALFEDPGIPPTVGDADPVRSSGSISDPVGTVMFYSADYTAKGVANKYKNQYGAQFTTRGGNAFYLTPPVGFNRYNFAGSPRHSGSLVINFADGHAAAKNATANLPGTGPDTTTTANTVVNCYNLPFDLNGIPDTVGEPKD